LYSTVLGNELLHTKKMIRLKKKNQKTVPSITPPEILNGQFGEYR
jgi:hypothetical protein